MSDEFTSAWLATLPNQGHWTYALFARVPGVDPEEKVQPVYVGVTDDLRSRLRAHSRKWWWRALDLELSELLSYPTRDAAERAERESIRSWQPAMNRSGRLLVVTEV